MIGLVLVTHGQLATEFRAALEHVVGPQSQIESVTIGPHCVSPSSEKTHDWQLDDTPVLRSAQVVAVPKLL